MPPAHVERYIRSIFVQNIPAGITEELFRQIISQCGALIHFHMFFNTTGGNNANELGSRGYAFAEVSNLTLLDQIYMREDELPRGNAPL